MRVLQVGPLYNNHLRRWCAHARDLGAEVWAAGHVRPHRRQVDLDEMTIGVEVLSPELLDEHPKSHVPWLRAVIEEVRPDLVQAHWLPRWGYAAVACGGPPVLLTPWGSDVYAVTGPERRRADQALRGADGLLLSRSPHMEREILGRGVSASLYQVDLGVDLERFRPLPAEGRARLRQELELPPGPLVLSFRSGTPLYNLDVVFDAFRLLRTRLPGATLVLARGDAPLAPRAAEASNGLAGVRDLGNVPHSGMHRLFQAADAGLSIPRSDGSPSSVWEALACGLPVVLSDLPQIAERVGASGARLVEPRPEPVAAALEEVLDAREGMSAAGRRWAEANVDERVQVERLGRAYAAAIGRAPVRGPEPPERELRSAPPAGRRAPGAAAPPRPS